MMHKHQIGVVLDDTQTPSWSEVSDTQTPDWEEVA